jgi:hypothetical protein
MNFWHMLQHEWALKIQVVYDYIYLRSLEQSNSKDKKKKKNRSGCKKAGGGGIGSYYLMATSFSLGRWTSSGVKIVMMVWAYLVPLNCIYKNY